MATIRQKVFARLGRRPADRSQVTTEAKPTSATSSGLACHSPATTLALSSRRRSIIQWPTLVFVIFCWPAAGCVMLDAWKFKHKEVAPCGIAAQIATTWDNQVAFVPNVVDEGKPVPCLTGRLFLFSRDLSVPVVSDGELKVQLFRNDMLGPDGSPLLIEQWNVDSTTMPNMVSKDIIGWGYSLVLPWRSYHPGLTNLELSVCFIPAEGYPMYSRTKLKLQQDRPFTRQQHTIAPYAKE